jgi:methionine-rich copper-binding protein CopC
MRLCATTAIAAAIILLQFTMPAIAHTAVAGTKPKSGSVLAASPPVVEINFEHTTHLTSVVVLEAGKAQRSLAFTPSGGARSFRLPVPKLGPGRSEIQWKALSSDGHVVSGLLVLVIKPATTKID